MTNISACLDQAIRLHNAGDFSAAEKLYRQILQSDPSQADALSLLGSILSGKDLHAEALPLLRKAIHIDPAAPLFYLNYGNALSKAHKFEEAIRAFEKSITLQPSLAEAHYNLGNSKRSLERWNDAIDAYKAALSLRPTYAEAHNNLALVYEKTFHLEKAIDHLNTAVKDHPAYGEGWLNLCNFAEKAGLYDLALSAGQQAVKLLPAKPSAWLGLGVVLNRFNRDQDAIAAYIKALELAPDRIDILDNLGQSYQFLGDLPAAEAIYRKIIDLSGQTLPDPPTDHEYPESIYGNHHWHLALIELLQGKYLTGFDRYRSRFKEVPNLHRPNFPKPLWMGEDLNDKTILIWDEQGFGDCLMLCRYLPMLKNKGAKVSFLLQPPLVSLFEGWSGIDKIIQRGTLLKADDFDFHASIFDLPYRFKTTLENIPAPIGYLPIPPIALDKKLPDVFPKIALVWAGTPKHLHDTRRSIPFSLLSNLLATEGAHFFSLNRDQRPGEDILLQHYPITDLAPQLNSFLDTAQFIEQMDLIITVDTSTAHLAGGMGKPVWLFVPAAPDWRWLAGRSDSSWYPTLRLFRQDKAGDWREIIDLMHQNLKQWILEVKAKK